jgi:hypothetical protein
MKRRSFAYMAFAIGVLVLGLAATSPARANFSVVKFEAGYCRIWWDSGATPWGTNWTKVATAPDFVAAWAAQDALVKKGTCK